MNRLIMNGLSAIYESVLSAMNTDETFAMAAPKAADGKIDHSVKIPMALRKTCTAALRRSWMR
jgi:hypothetical protein